MISPIERAEAPKVTIEDLLRIKRAERPAPEFWGRFEQELRAKQLSAIVAKRPWWQSIKPAQGLRWISRFYMPVGASALMVFGLLAVKENAALWPSSVVIEEDGGVHAPALSLVPQVSLASNEQRVETLPAPTETISGPTAVARYDILAREAEVKGSSYAHSVQARRVTGPGGLLEMIPWAAPLTETAAPQPPAPLVLGELPQVTFAENVLPGRDYRFDGRVEVDPVVMPVRRAAAESKPKEQAAPVLSPRELRRDRILANLVVAEGVEADRSRMGQVREVLVSALDDDRLYDGVRRLGMGGDRLTLKF